VVLLLVLLMVVLVVLVLMLMVLVLVVARVVVVRVVVGQVGCVGVPGAQAVHVAPVLAAHAEHVALQDAELPAQHG